MELEIIEDPDESEINEIRNRLRAYDAPHREIADRYTFSMILRDEKILIGGVVYTIFGEWLEIDYFWVDSEKRNQGYGKKILDEVETFARQKGCKRSYLNTLNFQAKPFYEKYGYLVVYTQKNFPVINCRYFMEKTL